MHIYIMVLKNTLRIVASEQRKELESLGNGIKRKKLDEIDLKTPFVVILSGIRRCGKSTLLRQLIEKSKHFKYFNFEDQRVFGFEVSDFEKLEEVLNEAGKSNLYFFDEVQNVVGWERFVRKLQDSGKKTVLTGSNASLLSRELGTKLTGRHIRYELFPFSYHEMLKFTSRKASRKSFLEYLKLGGFPEFLKFRKIEILQELLIDIVTRDIITRYGLREEKIIKEMAIYMLTNVGKEFSYNQLAKAFGLGSANTAISYMSYFEDSYLLFTVPKFDYSYKKQVVNQKKVYSIDTGLSSANSASFSEDIGRSLENAVFLSIRRKHKDIFYFKGLMECDFIIREMGKPLSAIQVCAEITEDNKEREISGIQEAMEKLKIKEGVIVTLNQEDKIGNINLVPAWKWL